MPVKLVVTALAKRFLPDREKMVRKALRMWGNYAKLLRHKGAMAELMKRVDAHAMAHATVNGVTFGTIQDFFQWILDHQEEIIALIKAVMLLFGL